MEQGTEPLSDTTVLAEQAASIGADKLATDIVLLDMRGVVAYTDWFVVMTGSNTRQVQAIAEEVGLRMKREHGLIPLRTEGMKEGTWVLIDFLDIVVHVFVPESRELYRLDELWGQVPHTLVAEG
ncbi:MAG: ribosome silencing factor [Actinobacteria bacterium]|nr:ribosome silencing factor [Actinomycetota bacterium]